MDPKYLLGIPEIDFQHEEIHALVVSLQEIIAARDKQYLVRPVLKRLSYLLTNHFTTEESLMAMISYAELPPHRKMHQGILKLFEDYFALPPSESEYDELGKIISDRVLGHVMEHDLQMTAVVKSYLTNFKSA